MHPIYAKMENTDKYHGSLEYKVNRNIILVQQFLSTSPIVMRWPVTDFDRFVYENIIKKCKKLKKKQQKF